MLEFSQLPEGQNDNREMAREDRMVLREGRSKKWGGGAMIGRVRIYNEAEVESILRASERRRAHGRRGRPGPRGHTGELHVLLSNAALAERADSFDNTDTPIACAFVGTPEAVRAVTEALNSAEGQAALQHLDENYPTGIRVRLDAQVPTPVAARYSGGMEIVRLATVTSVRVIMDRIEEELSFGLHIQTAFPILYFHRGGPAWLDSRNQWH